MLRLIEWAVANSLTVAVLAPVVFVVGRCSRQPALRHSLWILLLLKLITPPLVSIDIPTEWARFAQTSFSSTRSAPTADAPLPTPAPISGTAPATVSTIAPASVSPALRPTAEPQSAATATSRSPQVESTAAPVSSSAPSPAPAVASLPPAPSMFAELWPAMIRGLLVVWVAGSVLFFIVQGVRLVLFSRRLRRSSYSFAPLTAEKDAITEGLGRTASPATLMVNGVVSPMLWGLGPWCRILFPADLYRQLTPEARRTLLLHELAHYYRGDHWVRVLEIVAANLFWWHPAVWWSLREIESSEEECCDNWVMRRTTSTPRCYAEALLDTIDFLCEQNPLAPPVASGLGNPRELRGRLVRIMEGGRARTINAAGRLVVALVLLGLPLQPQALAIWSLSLRDAIGLDSQEGDDRLADQTTETRPAGTPAEVSATGNSPRAAARSSGPRPSSRLSANSSSSLPSDWAKAVSADEQFEVRARTGRRVELFDRRTSTATPLTPWNVASVAFLPTRAQFVSGGFDRQIRLWDASTGKPLTTFDEGSDAVVSIAASPDGTRIGSGTRSGEVSLYGTDSLIRESQWTFDAPINCVRFSPGSDKLLVSTGGWRQETSGEIALVDVATGQIERRIAIEKPAGVIAFTDEPDVVAAGAWDGRQSFVDLATGTVVASTNISKDLVSAAAFSADTRVFPGATLEEARRAPIRSRPEKTARAAAAPEPRFFSIGPTGPQWKIFLPDFDGTP